MFTIKGTQTMDTLLVSYCCKKRRLSELKDKLQNGNSDDEILKYCDYHNENKIWTLQSLMNIIASQGYTESDIFNYYKQKKYELWIKLISADWFSIFLTYLDVKDIVRLDSAFTNHVGRLKWLRLLKDIKPNITIKNNLFIDKISNWMIQKDVHPNAISLSYTDDKELSDDYVYNLFQTSPNLKTFELVNSTSSSSMNQSWPSCLASFCPDLEYLKLHLVTEPDNCFEDISTRCHKIKSLELKYVSFSGLDVLLKLNRNLVSVKICVRNDDPNTTLIGEIFEILGQYCPLIQECELQAFKLRATDIQINTFTKGCINLKSLITRGEGGTSRFFNKLLNSLGSYNTALEELDLYNDEGGTDEDSVTSEQSTSLQSLTIGYPLLHTLILYGFKNLSTSNISYLLNHTTKLRILDVCSCDLCQDDEVITIDEGKLKYLERLELDSNSNITDESMINIVKGCNKLEMIDIQFCYELTDTSLLSIAENCPDLKRVDLDFDNEKITTIGLLELLKKCLKLTEIDSSNLDLPKVIKDQLKKRGT